MAFPVCSKVIHRVIHSPNAFALIALILPYFCHNLATIVWDNTYSEKGRSTGAKWQSATALTPGEKAQGSLTS